MHSMARVGFVSPDRSLSNKGWDDGQQCGESEGLGAAQLARVDITPQQLDPYDRDCIERRGFVTLMDEGGQSDWLEAAPGLGMAGLALYLILGSAIGQVWFWVAFPLLSLVGLGFVIKGFRGGASEAFRWGQQMLSLVGVLVVGAVLPALALWFATDLSDIASGDRFFLLELFDSEQSRGVVLRAVQFGFMTTATMLPAILFFLFDRERLATLRDRFVRTAFRLDPSLKSLDDLEARYGGPLSEMYGGAGVTSGGRLVGGRRFPVVVATGVLAFGWFLTLANLSISVADLSSGAVGPLELLIPEPSVLSYGFLGAYFFSLQRVLRGYLRGDLRAKTYSHVAVRVFLVVILTWIIEMLFDGSANAYLLGATFMIGIVPDTALKALQQFFRGTGGFLRKAAKSAPDLYEREPLTKIHGIDVYDWARLIDEGVTNVEGLAHTALIALLLQTRIPTPRLMDWLDQAILRIHVDDELRTEIERFGVRKATELTALWKDKDVDFASKLSPDCDFANRLDIVVLTLEGEEWLKTIQDWRAGRDVKVPVIKIVGFRDDGEEGDSAANDEESEPGDEDSLPAVPEDA